MIKLSLSRSLALSITLLINSLIYNFAYADANVMGEEISIYADDTFKPASRDLGGSEINPRKPGGRLGDALDTTLPDITDLNQDDGTQAEVITIGSEDLWQRIKNGYAIPNLTSSLVTHHEEYYSSRPDYVKRIVERSQKYLFHIVEEIEKRGMPTEIALLPMIESAYNPQAYSSGRASGIWQFIPSTGKHFGLKQNWWVDNRRNVTIATDAALDYLQKLHGMFGSWDLALAAYNAGEGTVGRAIERNRKLGLATDYESLNLPVETRNYVPKLQAIKNLMTNPGKYGLKIQTIANTPYFARVSAPAQIDAHLAAKLAEISDAEFSALNPSNNRPVITSNGAKQEILLPISSAQTFRNNLAAYNKPLVSWQTYYAKRGERMENIASKFGIDVSKLRNANNLPTHEKIKKSSTILVPNGHATDFVPSKPAESVETPTSEIETENAVSSEVSAKQNSANIDLEHAEQQATRAAADEEADNKAVTTEQTKQRNITHKVKKGETMQSIAKHNKVSVKEIIKLNSLRNDHVKVGQLLTVKTEAVKITAENRHIKNRKEGGKENKNTNKAKGKTNKNSKTSSKTSSKNKSVKGKTIHDKSNQGKTKPSTSKTKSTVKVTTSKKKSKK